MKLLIFITIFFSVSFTFASAKDCMSDKTYGEVTKTELKNLIDTKTAFVVDVNTADSFAKNNIPTSINFEQNKSKLAEKLPTDKNSLIVAYCGGPACTAWKSAAQAACKLGYTNVKHYKGGIKGWLDPKG